MTLVVDASVVAEVLLGTARGRVAIPRLESHELIAPDHLTAEVVSVLRGWSLSGHLSDAVARTAFEEFAALQITQVPMLNRLGEVWELRHNISAYDALYVVLARVTQSALLTLDRRLAQAAPDCAVLP